MDTYREEQGNASGTGKKKEQSLTKTNSFRAPTVESSDRRSSIEEMRTARIEAKSNKIGEKR